MVASPVLRPVQLVIFIAVPPPTRSTLFPYTTLFRSFLHAPYMVNVASPNADFRRRSVDLARATVALADRARSEEHTSELQSPYDLVCRLLPEKKKMEPIRQVLT